MPVVLANDLLALHLPQPRIMVGASSNQVSRVGREGAVPHPALVTRERLLQGVGLGLGLGGVGVVVGGLDVAHLPDLGRVVGAARRQLLNVRREQNAGDVFLMGVEMGDGDQLRALEVLDELPDEYVALRKGQYKHHLGGEKEEGEGLCVPNYCQRKVGNHRSRR